MSSDFNGVYDFHMMDDSDVAGSRDEWADMVNDVPPLNHPDLAHFGALITRISPNAAAPRFAIKISASPYEPRLRDFLPGGWCAQTFTNIDGAQSALNTAMPELTNIKVSQLGIIPPKFELSMEGELNPNPMPFGSYRDAFAYYYFDDLLFAFRCGQCCARDWGRVDSLRRSLAMPLTSTHMHDRFLN